MNVDKDIVYLPEDDGIDVPYDQRQLISNNPYFKPRKERVLTIQKMSSQVYREKLGKETEDQKKKRLIQNKASAAKCREKKTTEYYNVKE